MDEYQQIFDFEQVRNLLSNPSTENWFYLIQYLTLTHKKHHQTFDSNKHEFDDFFSITKPYILQHLNDWPIQFKYAILPLMNPPKPLTPTGQVYPPEQEYLALAMASTLVLTPKQEYPIQSLPQAASTHSNSIHWHRFFPIPAPANTTPTTPPNTPTLENYTITATPLIVFDQLACTHTPLTIRGMNSITCRNHPHLQWLKQQDVATALQHLHFRSCSFNDAFLYHDFASTHTIIPGLAQIIEAHAPNFQSITFDNCPFIIGNAHIFETFLQWATNHNVKMTFNQCSFSKTSASLRVSVAFNFSRLKNIHFNPRIPETPLTYHMFV